MADYLREPLVAPAERPVTPAEAKAHMRFSSTAEDALIASLIDTAVALLEGPYGMLGRALVTQRWRVHLKGFAPRLDLPLPPLQSVESVKYRDASGTLVTLDPSIYEVDKHLRVGSIRLAYGKTWPATELHAWPVQVEMTCGYGGAAAVPATLKQAILMLVTHWFVNRGAVGTVPDGMAFSVEALTRPHTQPVM